MDILTLANSRSIRSKPKIQSFPLSRSNTADYGSLVWTFDPDNHYLHPRLVELVFSKRVLYTLAAAVLPGFFLPMFPRWVYYAYWAIVSVLLTIPSFTLVVLSFNRDARGFILKSSEFWIKVIYAFAGSVLEIVHFHQVLRQMHSDELPAYLGYTQCVTWLIVGPLIIICVGAIDAIPRVTHKWKATLTGLTASWYTMRAIEYQFLKSKAEDFKINIEATDGEISFHSLLSNVYGMLAIFLWKQTMDVIRNKDRCISITYRPYLRWARPAEDINSLDVEEIPESAQVTELSVDNRNCTAHLEQDFSFVGL